MVRRSLALENTKKAPEQTFRRFLAFPRRFERPTYRLGGGCSILLSYGNICNKHKYIINLAKMQVFFKKSA